MADLAARLREVRARNRWTQIQVAEWTGIDAMTISHYESGRREPGPENLKKLADGLRVTADWLLGREPTPEMPETPAPIATPDESPA
jgi:transcriptional regulator with XRE-family HTH domain